MIFAMRNDGLGERLRAIVNAIVLAKTWNTDFRFTWTVNNSLKTDYHAVIEKEAFLSARFIKRFYVEHNEELKKNITELNSLEFNVATQDDLKKKLEDAGCYDIGVQQTPIEHQLHIKNFSPKITYNAAFNVIGFAPHIKKIMKKACKRIRNNKYIAIHLRSGDIVFGMFRTMERYVNKVVSLAEAEVLISTLSSTEDIILFGQDAEQCNFLSEKYNIQFIENFYPHSKMSKEERAMFDVKAMARCKDIYAGKSGFALLSAAISNTTINSLDDYDELKKVIFSYIKKDIFDIDPFHYSFSVFSFYSKNKERLTTNEKIVLIDFIINIDKNNYYYRLLKICLHIELNDIETAEELFINFISTQTDNIHGLREIATRIFPDKSNALNNVIQNVRIQEKSSLMILHLYNDFFYKKKKKEEILKKLNIINTKQEIKDIVIKDLKLCDVELNSMIERLEKQKT